MRNSAVDRTSDRVELLDRHGREHRLQFVGEESAQKLALRRRPVVGVEHMKVVLAQSVEHLADTDRLFFHHAVGAFGDGDELLPGSHPGRVASAYPGGSLLHQASDAHHVELVEVGADDGEELEPFEERHRAGQPFAENAVVELQPAELAVDEVLGGVQVDFCHGVLSVGLGAPIVIE